MIVFNSASQCTDKVIDFLFSENICEGYPADISKLYVTLDAIEIGKSIQESRGEKNSLYSSKDYRALT